MRRTPAAAGAIAGQATLAMGSFLLQILASRNLGAQGLGAFALLFGAIVVATAVSSGLVGDTLTVLDRHSPPIRAALAWTAVTLVTGAASIAAATSVITGFTLPTALVIGAATAAFMTADLLRRTLMACQLFWRLVLVDGIALLAGLLVLAIFAAAGEWRLVHFVAALAVGQTVACAIAWRSLPDVERARPPAIMGDLAAVAGFGCWRAAQQFVRPTTLNLARWMVLVVAGQSAVGELEGARIFVAPALLLVQGVGAYLFASFAANPEVAARVMLRRADRGAAALLSASLILALLAMAAVPVLGGLLTKDGYRLAEVTVLGWGVYAGSCAVVLPYGALAAVRGRQAQVFGLRLVDSVAGLAAVAAALWVYELSPATVPWLLAVGSVVSGILVRQVLVVPAGRTRAVTGDLLPEDTHQEVLA